MQLDAYMAFSHILGAWQLAIQKGLSMHEGKERQTAVCWRVKESHLEWLRQVAKQQERPVTWVINKMLEKAKQEQHEKAAA